jgi:hypothetical protein
MSSFTDLNITNLKVSKAEPLLERSTRGDAARSHLHSWAHSSLSSFSKLQISTLSLSL